MTPIRHLPGMVLACGLLMAGCTSEPTPQRADEGQSSDGDRLVQLGAPGESPTEVSSEALESAGSPTYTEADVAFVQAMIAHHVQALEMTAMVPERAGRDDLPLLAERMEVSQTDEVVQMEAWLAERGEDVPVLEPRDGSGPRSRHGSGHSDDQGRAESMPGMLTEAELVQLEAAGGAEFDRLFLEWMIRHHEGAVLMVERLLTEGEGGQESAVFQLAQHIDSDQRVEIARMKSLLAELG